MGFFQFNEIQFGKLIVLNFILELGIWILFVLMSCSIINKKYSQIKQEKQKKSQYEIFLHYMSKDAVFISHESSQGIDVHITCKHKLEGFFLLF